MDAKDQALARAPDEPADRADSAGRRLRNRVIHDVRLQRYQHINAAVTAGLGVAGVLSAAALSIHAGGVSGTDIALFLLYFIPIQLGVTVGFHRYFCHRSFTADSGTRSALAILGSMAAQGPVVFWVALHRMHHEFADHEGDPHSPNLSGEKLSQRAKGLVHAYIGWITRHAVPNANHYARDLLRDSRVMWINRRYYLWVAAGLALPTITGAVLLRGWAGALEGFLWGGLVRMCVGHNMIWWITSFAHVVGKREYRTADRSTNNFWIAIPTLGESWHNNHHSFPNAAVLDFQWWQVDISGATIRILRRLGLARDVVIPNRTALDARRIGADGVRAETTEQVKKVGSDA